MALDPYGAANDMLDEVVSCLQGNGYDVPDCVFVSAGEPAADCCDQLVATLGKWSKTAPAGGTASSPCGALWRVEVSIRLYVCVPSLDDAGTFPPCDEQDAAAQAMLGQLATIVTCLNCGCTDGSCRRRDVTSAKISGPKGGCAILEVSVTVDA